MALYSPSTPNHFRCGTPASFRNHFHYIQHQELVIKIKEQCLQVKTYSLLVEAYTILTHNEAEDALSSQIPVNGDDNEIHGQRNK